MPADGNWLGAVEPFSKPRVAGRKGEEAFVGTKLVLNRGLAMNSDSWYAKAMQQGFILCS